MRHVARGIVKDDAAAEEVVQETWLAVVEGLESLDDPHALVAWIYRILVNKARRRGAREARSTAFSELTDPDDPAPFEDSDQFNRLGMWRGSIPAWGQITPEQLASDRQRLTLVNKAVERLPDRQRTMLLLTATGGLSPGEAAGSLGIGVGHARVLLHRARVRLRKELHPHVTWRGRR